MTSTIAEDGKFKLTIQVHVSRGMPEHNQGRLAKRSQFKCFTKMY